MDVYKRIYGKNILRLNTSAVELGAYKLVTKRKLLVLPHHPAHGSNSRRSLDFSAKMAMYSSIYLYKKMLYISVGMLLLSLYIS